MNNTNNLLEFPLPPTIHSSTSLVPPANPWRMPELDDGNDRSGRQGGDLLSEDEGDDDDSNSDTVEQLLHNEPAIPSVYVKPQNRPFKDTTFLFLYAGCLLSMITLGLVFVATKNNNFSVAKSLFLPLWNSAGGLFSNKLIIGLLTGLAAGSLILSLFWLYLLSKFSNLILVATGVILPISIVAVSLISFLRFLSTQPVSPGEASEFRSLATVSVIGIFGGLYTGWLAFKSRRMLETMNVIVNLTTEILTANSSLFVLSATLALFHLAFSIFWLWLFSHIFLQGSIISTGKDMTIVMTPAGPYIAVYFILLYFWTSAILQNVEKVTVASVVGEWYFDRFDHTNTTDETWFHFQFVSTRSFGSISFASLILGIVRTIQFCVKQIEKYGSQRLLNSRLISVCLALFSKFLEDFSAYTLVHVGLTGESLASSAYQCSRLFRRNLILGLLTSNLSKLMSFVGKVFISSIIGLICFWSSLQFQETGGEWITIFVATLIPYYVMGILTHVVETTIDATFICYLVDLNNNACSHDKAHRIFSASLK